jgi:outer membrane lipoprotein LolB
LKILLRPAAWVIAVFALLLQACSITPQPAADGAAAARSYDARKKALVSLETWSLKARLAVSDGEDGGSGSLQWVVGEAGTRMNFHGALGRGAWRLESNDRGARLELADGTFYEADTGAELAARQLDWAVPVDALSWWVRGLAAPGMVEHRELGADGALVFLRQQGWNIEYGRFREVEGILLPLKLTARQSGRTVKLVIREWQLGFEDD